jgi:hypothetical protein
MIVALISTYLEGRQAQHAVRSALAACDRVIVVEGQAGPALPDAGKVPPTDLGGYSRRVNYHAGRWRSDAEKRTAMLEHIRHLQAPVWVLWLDGDEMLVNGEYLRDWVEHIQWRDELERAEWIKVAPTRDLIEQNAPAPTMRIPLRLVELDGSISMSYVKLVRGDLVKSYDLSIANLINSAGIAEQAGNLHEHISGWMAAHPRAGEGYLYWPPGPGPLDPFIVHRSLLRHPLRAGLRMNEQEAAEIAKRAAK